MIYYANGCSFTWGGEIFNMSGPNGEWLPEISYDHPLNKNRLESVYTHFLGQKIGATKIINESVCGGSNHRIVRKTLNYFNNLLINNQSFENHFVTIQWTDPSRHEYYSEEYKGWINLMSTGFSMEKRNKINTYTLKENHIYFYKNYNSIVQDFHDYIQQITLLGNFFKTHNIPYIFFQHSNFYGSFVKNNIITKQDFDKICFQFNWVKTNMDYHMQESGIDLCPDYHPSMLGHKQWADIVYDEIKSRNILYV